MKSIFSMILFILLFISACSNTGDDTAEGDGYEQVTDDQGILGSVGESCTSRRDCEEGLACFAQVCTRNSSEEENGDDSDAPVSDPRGGAGESCTSRRDCQEGLSCFAQVCTTHGSEEEDGDDSDVPIPDPRGGAGESCTSRRDCQEGLGCFDNVCLDRAVIEADAGSTQEIESPIARSELGESCRARNDCVEGLICVNATCVDKNVDIEVTAKSCVFVECSENADCCTGYEPSIPQTDCDIYKENCESDPITYQTYCTAYESQCECHSKCVDSRCETPLVINCTEDAHCATQLLTPYCVDNQCMECKEDEHCILEGDECIDNVCQEPPPPCVNNEQCPLMFACQDGDCVEVGCTTDRECFFYTGFDRSVCSLEKKCTIPCEADDDCVAQNTGINGHDPFWVCQTGTCVFVGCETDEECRVYLGLENLASSGAVAKCE